MNLGGKVESLAVEKDRLAKVVANLEARLKESESRLEESELRAAKDREAGRQLEE